MQDDRSLSDFMPNDGDFTAEAGAPLAAGTPIAAEAAPAAAEPAPSQDEADQAEPPAGELTLEAIGELLKERDDARQAKDGDRPENVRKIIERVNALADEMADPSHRSQSASAAPTVEAEAQPESEPAEDLGEATPAKAATGT